VCIIIVVIIISGAIAKSVAEMMDTRKELIIVVTL
jgi:hypothetical protein